MNHTGSPTRFGLADQSGMVGKAAVLWLLILAVFGIAVADAASIARTTLHTSEVAALAASRVFTHFGRPGSVAWRST